jgi:hypothetical protein
MYNNWTLDLSDSIKAIEKIKYTVLPKLISGDIISIEQQENEILLLFDRYSGIDYIRKNNIGLQGIASRVQFGKNWDTFTIRAQRHSGAKTEYQKRLEQIENGYFYPYFTMQAYFDNRQNMNLLSICIIKTIDLYYEIENNPNVSKQQSDNIFYFIKWSDLPNNKIKLYSNPEIY